MRRKFRMFHHEVISKPVGSAIIREVAGRGNKLIVFSDIAAKKTYCEYVSGFSARIMQEGIMPEHEEKGNENTPFVERPWVRVRTK